ncbi:MAG: hypothetical protein ACK56I_04450, partial [bacterium]
PHDRRCCVTIATNSAAVNNSTITSYVSLPITFLLLIAFHVATPTRAAFSLQIYRTTTRR